MFLRFAGFGVLGHALSYRLGLGLRMGLQRENFGRPSKKLKYLPAFNTNPRSPELREHVGTRKVDRGGPQTREHIL